MSFAPTSTLGRFGRIAVGMAHQGYDLQLTRYDERGWRATFYTTGMEHSPTSATGTVWQRTPGRRASVSITRLDSAEEPSRECARERPTSDSLLWRTDQPSGRECGRSCRLR